MKTKILILASIFLLACKHTVHNNIVDANLIDTANINNISVYCNNFYKEIDNALLGCSDKRMLHKTIQEVLESQKPYWIINNMDSIAIIKSIFLSNYTLIDSNVTNYTKVGDYFLLIKNGRQSNTLSYGVDSVWIYNQKYTIKYKINPMHELLKLQNAKGVDCFTCDSTKIITE